MKINEMETITKTMLAAYLDCQHDTYFTLLNMVTSMGYNLYISHVKDSTCFRLVLPSNNMGVCVYETDL